MIGPIGAILFTISIPVTAIFLAWLIGRDPEEWKAWKAIKKGGVSGFYRYKRFRVMSDDMLMGNPIIWCFTDQFIPLSNFVGKGHKPVPRKIWQIHYLLKLPYFWHARL